MDEVFSRIVTEMELCLSLAASYKRTKNMEAAVEAAAMCLWL